MSPLPALVERIRSEYLALPGLKLTPAQARRLWPASDEAIVAAIDTLVAEGFLCCLPSGSYIAAPRPRGSAAKADIEPQSAAPSIRCPHCQKLNAMNAEDLLRGAILSSSVRCIACGRVLHVAAMSA